MSKMTWFVCAMVLALCFVGACGPTEEETRAVEESQEWSILQEEHAALTAQREDLNTIREEITAGVEGDEETGMSPEEALLQLEKRGEEKEAEVNEAADAFSNNLVEFINKYAGYEGDEQSDLQRAAIRLKSGEDIELAREYVLKGGDYKRALNILQTTVIADPEYEALRQEKERLESLRWMDEERFSQVENGMTEAEVRALLGQVFHRNIKEYDEVNATAWFYPRTEGAAAAVFFREQRGEERVYEKDFNAVKPATERVE